MSDRVDVEVGGYRVQILIDGNTGPIVVLCSGLGAAGCTGVTRSLTLRMTILSCDSTGPAHR